MNMFDDLDRINTILRTDDELWKLLYYKSNGVNDDILSRPSVLDMPPNEKFPIINHRLKHTPVTDDLADNEICRIIFYPSPRRPQRQSYVIASQSVTFDIFVHRNYNDIDMRLAKICDRVNDLMSHKNIASLGKSEFVSGDPFTMTDEGYVGYTLIYKFGSVNAV